MRLGGDEFRDAAGWDPALSGEDDGDGFGDGIWFCRQLVIGRTPVHEKPLIRSRRCQIKTSSVIID